MKDVLERLEQLREACNEQLETARLVQGHDFANSAGTVFEIGQVLHLVGEILRRTALSEAEQLMYMTVASNLLSSISQQVLSHLPPDRARDAHQLGEAMGERFELLFTEGA